MAAVRSKRDASIVQAAAAVGDGRADALVSAGSTGPTLAAATLSIKRIKGVYRPRSPCCMPIPGGPVLLLDAGASVEVRPEHLVQFAYMGAGFMEAVRGHRAPVGGAAVGGRGVRQGHARRAHRPRPHRRGRRSTSSGNVEGFDLPNARASTWSWPTASPATSR